MLNNYQDELENEVVVVAPEPVVNNNVIIDAVLMERENTLRTTRSGRVVRPPQEVDL